MKRTAKVLVPAFIAAAACGSAGPPRVVVVGQSFDAIQFAWTHPSGDANEGYALERRIGAGEFSEVQRTNDPWQLGIGYEIPPEVPEVTNLEFRVRALPDPDGSRASASLAHRRGVRPPQFVACAGTSFVSCPVGVGPAGVHLVLANLSAVADQLLLERRIATPARVPGGFVRGEWAPLSTDPRATSYDDADVSAWVDGAALEYRLTAAKGAERSDPVAANTPAAALLPPAGVTATAIPGGVRLQFQNTSRAADEIRITREQLGRAASDTTAAVVPVATTSYDDVALAPGTYTYGFSARAFFGGGASTVVFVTVTVP